MRNKCDSDTNKKVAGSNNIIELIVIITSRDKVVLTAIFTVHTLHFATRKMKNFYDN